MKRQSKLWVALAIYLVLGVLEWFTLDDRKIRLAGLLILAFFARDRELCGAGLSGSNSVVESQPSKLLVAGSIPVSRSSIIFKPLRTVVRVART